MHPDYLNKPFYESLGSSYVYHAVLFDSAGTCTDFGWNTTQVLWKQGIGDIKHPSNLVMAGDNTIEYYCYFTYGYNNYRLMRMHDRVTYDCNVVFADGHVAGVVAQPSPDHLENDQYSLINN